MPPFHQESNSSDADGYAHATSSTSASEDTAAETSTINHNTSTTITRVNTFSPHTNSTTKKSERDDAFLRYSNDQVRMRTLMMSTATTTQGEEHTTTTHQAEQVERKTRLSFELHPSLIIEDLLQDLDYGDANGISDDVSFDDMILSLLQGQEEDDLMNDEKFTMLSSGQR